MTYAQARWAGVRLALLPWVRRVGLVLLLSLAALSGGSGDPLTLLQMLASGAAWTVLPLERGGLAAVPLQALVLALWLWVLREALQPARWLELERSWPLPPELLKRSDALLALAATSPLLLLQAAGLLALQNAALALLWLAGSLLGLLLGLMQMQRRRRGPRPASQQALAQRALVSSRRISATRALLLLPLLRAPLRRSAALLLAQALLLAAWPALLWSGLPAALVAMAGVALAWLGLQRANAWLDADMAPLLAALPPLPVDATALQRRLRLLALLPWLLALPSMLLAFALHPVRPAVAAALLLLLALLGPWCALQRLAAADHHAVRLLLGLALLLALASEVFAA